MWSILERLRRIVSSLPYMHLEEQFFQVGPVAVLAHDLSVWFFVPHLSFCRKEVIGYWIGSLSGHGLVFRSCLH